MIDKKRRLSSGYEGRRSVAPTRSGGCAEESRVQGRYRNGAQATLGDKLCLVGWQRWWSTCHGERWRHRCQRVALRSGFGVASDGGKGRHCVRVRG
ncbi:hypothetical protein U1Q18_012548 [Sarracenia purpurea var. burkii]